ncbi:MAG: hypothetical protein ACP5OO_04845 [Chloroflexia bacterium]
MELGPLHWSVEQLIWAGFVFFGGLLIVFRGWWIELLGLLGIYGLLCLLLSRFPFMLPDLQMGPLVLSRVILAQAATGLTIVAVLAVTIAVRRRVTLEMQPPLDEVTEARLRWTAWRTARLGRGQRFRLAAYLFPVFAFAVLVLAAHGLALVYPVVRRPGAPDGLLWGYVDLVWYWLGLAGLLTVLLAQEMHEVSVGLLLCWSSVTLLYIALSRTIGLLALGLLSAVAILMGLGSAYLALLFYLRLRRWRLPSAEEWE